MFTNTAKIAHEIETLTANAKAYQTLANQYRMNGEIEKAFQTMEIAVEAQRTADTLTAFIARQN